MNNCDSAFELLNSSMFESVKVYVIRIFRVFKATLDILYLILVFNSQ